MPTAKVPANRVGRVLTAFVAACGICAAGEVRGQTDPTLTRYDVTARPIELIPPGTVIEKTAPAPYTHLIVKSYPRLGAGDLNAVNEMTKQLASFLHTSLVAKTAPYGVNGETRHRLEEVATGFGTNIRGRGDTVISPDAERKLGANLSFFQRLVLSKCYEEQQKSRYVARSDTLALVDTPLIIVRNDQHRRAILRYALLVSERSGRLDTLLWMIDLDAQGRYLAPAGEIHWLAPNTLVDCVMHVDADVLLVDEVLAVGDGAFQQKCLARLRQLGSEGRTLVIVTHDLPVARELCNRALWIRRGELALDGPAAETIDAYETALGRGEA